MKCGDVGFGLGTDTSGYSVGWTVGLSRMRSFRRALQVQVGLVGVGGLRWT